MIPWNLLFPVGEFLLFSRMKIKYRSQGNGTQNTLFIGVDAADFQSVGRH